MLLMYFQIKMQIQKKLVYNSSVANGTITIKFKCRLFRGSLLTGRSLVYRLLCARCRHAHRSAPTMINLIKEKKNQSRDEDNQERP
jgi:hypothetical protein